MKQQDASFSSSPTHAAGSRRKRKNLAAAITVITITVSDFSFAMRRGGGR